MNTTFWIHSGFFVVYVFKDGSWDFITYQSNHPWKTDFNPLAVMNCLWFFMQYTLETDYHGNPQLDKMEKTTIVWLSPIETSITQLWKFSIFKPYF